jgi:MinD superfamily P-loop ATPase
VIESVRGSDYLLLVTEPTPFGLNDLRLAVGMARALGLPFSVVINRSGWTDGLVADYCAAEEIEILARIPDDRKLAEACSRGQCVPYILETYSGELEGIAVRIGAFSAEGAGSI